jgi:type IV secretion system protein VirB4
VPFDLFARWFNHTIGEKVPWVGHCDPPYENDVLFDDGSFCTLIELRGIAWQTHDAEQIAEAETRLNNTFCQVAHDQLTLTVYQHHGPAPQSIWPPEPERPPYAADLAMRYKAHLLDDRLYRRPIFLSVMMSPPEIVRTKNKLLKQSDETDDERLVRLETTVDQLMEELKDYAPKRLGVAVRNGTRFSEFAETIHLLMTGVWQEIGITDGRLGDDLFDSAVNFKGDIIHFLMIGEERFGMVLGMQRKPAETHPLILQRMLACSYQCTISHSFRFTSNTKALGKTARKRAIKRKVGDPSLTQTADLSELLDDLSSGALVMGSLSSVFLVFSQTPEGLRQIASAARNDLAASGAKVVREYAALRAAYLSMIPGNAHMNIRAINATSFNMTSFAPMHNFPTGPERGHWGEPITLFISPAMTPIFFHWHAEGDDVGNALITGETGSGKTTLTAFLLAMTTGRAKVIALDHKRGWDFLIRRMGGRYSVLGSGRPMFAPLKALANTDRNRAFLVDLIRGCIGGEMTADEEQWLSDGIAIVMEMEPSRRALKEVRQLLGKDREGAGARLEKWCAGGELGWVIDAETDAIDLSSSLCGLDTTALLDNDRAAGPALAYLFHRINLELNGEPTLIAVDEGWRALGYPVFGGMIAAQIRTIRSKNGVFVFVTQGAEDIAESGLAGTLVQQCPTQLHLPSRRASEEDYVDGLKRTKGEFAALRELPKKSGLFLLCQGSDSVVAQLPLHGMDDILATLSASEADLQTFDRALARAGNAAEALAAV